MYQVSMQNQDKAGITHCSNFCDGRPVSVIEVFRQEIKVQTVLYLLSESSCQILIVIRK